MTEDKKPSDKDVPSSVAKLRVAASDRVSSLDPRTHAACFRTWLAALARDATAATAAALAYEALPAQGRDAWLDALDADAPAVAVPKIALYAPLLAVEQDEARRARIAAEVTGGPTRSTPPRALVGWKDGKRVCLIVSPLYLDFVELLLCTYVEDEGIRDARHEWLVHEEEIGMCAEELGITMTNAPLRQVVEELAHAVVADRRAARDAPPALLRYVDLFALDLTEREEIDAVANPLDLDKRCGSCARFVRVVEKIDENGEVRRHGECLLGVWPAPLYATSTCSHYVKRGTFTAKAQPPKRAHGFGGRLSRSLSGSASAPARLEIELPEELLDMNADEFREVLREVLRDELGLSDTPIGGRWEGGEMILKPGKEGTAEKRVPIDALFSKIVMIRDKLRVLEQKINAHPKLVAEEKVAMQGYITGCYGSLTTFNVLFANKGDNFVGQKGDE